MRPLKPAAGSKTIQMTNQRRHCYGTCAWSSLRYVTKLHRYVFVDNNWLEVCIIAISFLFLCFQRTTLCLAVATILYVVFFFFLGGGVSLLVVYVFERMLHDLLAWLVIWCSPIYHLRTWLLGFTAGGSSSNPTTYIKAKSNEVLNSSGMYIIETCLYPHMREIDFCFTFITYPDKYRRNATWYFLRCLYM